MASSLLYRLFKVGRLPKELSKKIAEDSLIHLEEGISVTIVFKNFKSPRKRFKSKIIKASGAICLTKAAFYTSVYRRVTIQLGWDDPKIKSIDFQVTDKHLIMGFDVSKFDEQSEGMVAYKFKCEDPEKVKNLILNR
jgi:hypothetical protein